MAELHPAPFAGLVTRLHREPQRQDALFELPRRKWWFPGSDGPDLSARFHGAIAGNPVGPAAGPHTQMAQNILLSYVAGGRILELKTVQVLDELKIARPCIDMTTVGYNIEWSQELRIEQSLREYVAGAMLIEMFRRGPLAEGRLDSLAGNAIYDLSVGYDLKGIRSRKVCDFLTGMRDASVEIDRLRAEIPREFCAERDAEYASQLSASITLSTFHGCPADEIESICEFLIGELDFDVIVKMNPPTLGREKLEHLLFDVMGYTDLTVNPEAYDAAIPLDESLELCGRLNDFAARRDRRVGFKFSNTLEVLNHREFFTADNEIQYLSGQPLHVITMALTDEFRRAAGPHVPISFSAGIDRWNLSDAVACGFVPVTISTDLLRPGGYDRLSGYVEALVAAMRQCQAENLDQFVLRHFGHEAEARRRAAEDAEGSGAVAWAGVLNTTALAARAREDERYYAHRNAKAPTRIDSHLVVFDCVTCDKCLPVCPNAANFKYATPIVSFWYTDLIVAPDGTASACAEDRWFEISRPLQIACYADFCNLCGNCDTFCPEYGGPYIEKPSFHGSRATYDAAAPRDGFVVERREHGAEIVGRIHSIEYGLEIDEATATATLRSANWTARFRTSDHSFVQMKPLPIGESRRIDMWIYHTMRHLLAGILDSERLNQVNVRYCR